MIPLGAEVKVKSIWGRGEWFYGTIHRHHKKCKLYDIPVKDKDGVFRGLMSVTEDRIVVEQTELF